MVNASIYCRPPPAMVNGSTEPMTPTTAMSSLAADTANVHHRATQQIAETMDSAPARQEGSPSSAVNESAKGRPGRKRKELPPGFQRVEEEGSERSFWIAPDKSKCSSWKQIDSWMQQNRPNVAWSGARLAFAQAAPGQLKASSIDEGQFEMNDPPDKIEAFLGFVVHYLSQENKEDEVYDLLNQRTPHINGVHVNLCELFHNVRGHGGKEKMHMRVWQSVLQNMKLPASKEDARAVEAVYERFLACCESKTWNDGELQAHAQVISTKEKKATLKTLLHRGLLRVGQRLLWSLPKRKADHDEKGQRPGSDIMIEGFLNEDGHIEFESNSYRSLNAFATAANIRLGTSGAKSKSDNINGWTSVRTTSPGGRTQTLQQIKNQYLGKTADKSRMAMLQPDVLFAGHAANLRAQKTQAEVREREELERQQQLDREKLLASNPPPSWNQQQQDDARHREDVEKGARLQFEDENFAKLLADLDSASNSENVDLAENVLQQLIEGILQPNAKLLDDVYNSPLALTRLTKCCWSWICKSSFVLPYGAWQMNMHIVNQRLENELNPKKGHMRWRHKGRFASATNGVGLQSRGSIGSQYQASRLPPDWRREEREPESGRGYKNPNFKFYTYFAPDGKTFQRWPDALQYFVEKETEKLREAARQGNAAQVDNEETAFGNPAHDTGGRGIEEDKSGGDSNMADVDAGADEDDEGEDDEDVADDEESDSRLQQPRQTDHNAQLAWCQSNISSQGTCAVVERDLIFGPMFATTREGGLQAARYARLAKSYILMLKLICRDRRGMARVGSHGATVQLLMEIVSAELPVPLDKAIDDSATIKSLCLELLIAFAHVINLKVAPGKRLLRVVAKVTSLAVETQDSSGMLCQLTHLLARLADCPHNKQVMVEQEHEILPTVLPLIMYPRGAGGLKVLSMALDAVHRFSSFGAIPSVLRRLNGTPGCISALVHIVGGAWEPDHKQNQPGRPVGAGRVELCDRIHAARVLLKVAEGSGGIASLQRHEKELV